MDLWRSHTATKHYVSCHHCTIDVGFNVGHSHILCNCFIHKYSYILSNPVFIFDYNLFPVPL